MALLRRKRKRKAPPAKQRPFQRGKGPLQLYRLIPSRLGLRSLISPVRQLESRAFARGASGNRLFGNVFLVVISARAARQAMKRKPQTLAYDKLAPGQGISVRTAKAPKRGMDTRERQQGLPS